VAVEGVLKSPTPNISLIKGFFKLKESLTGLYFIDYNTSTKYVGSMQNNRRVGYGCL
jgi:hypothetical protein